MATTNFDSTKSRYVVQWVDPETGRRRKRMFLCERGADRSRVKLEDAVDAFRSDSQLPYPQLPAANKPSEGRAELVEA